MIDAHHHIWRQHDLPWLLGPEQPRIFGAYAPIKRDYLIDEYLDDLDGTGIEKSVYVQANWAPNWAEDEIAWVQACADKAGWPHAIVGFADFTQPDIRPLLAKLARYPLLRGFRQQLHWHENPLYRFAPEYQIRHPNLARNISALADHGWTFDLQVFGSQMKDAAGLAKACPDVTFILQHAGMPEDRTKAGTKTWRDGMKRLADQPNVVTKLSGLGTFIHRNDPGFVAEIVGQTLEVFEPNRALYGSNFPIEKIWTPYRPLFDAFRDAVAGLSKPAQNAVFNDTAERVYRL